MMHNFSYLLIVSLLCSFLNYTTPCESLHKPESQKIISNLIDFSENFAFFLKEISEQKYNDPNYNRFASVRLSSNLCDEEKNFLVYRANKVQQTLEFLVNDESTINKVPRIALCFSGGGYRALIGTMAVLKSAQEVGLLDLTTYISSLSGSTWALALASILNNDLDSCTDLTRNEVSNELTANFNFNSVIFNSVSNLIYKQKFSLVSIWGLLLGNRLLNKFSSGNYCTKLSQITKFVEFGNLPLPIFTAGLVEPNDEYDWIEFTPFEIGGLKANTFIPSWSFNRIFKYLLFIDYIWI